MTVAVAVASAVALVAIVALLIVGRTRSTQLDAERSRSQQLSGDLAEARREGDDARRAGHEAHRAAEEAGRARDEALARADAAEQRAAEADRRSADAEGRAAEARLRADRLEQLADKAAQQAEEAQRRAAEAAAAGGGGEEAGGGEEGPAAGGTFWELERIRLEREWRDVAGASVPLPVPWDGGVAAAVAVELEIIREVIGTPSRLEPAPGPVRLQPAAAATATRLAAELLRRLARGGEEMVVSLAEDDGLIVTVSTGGPVGAEDVAPVAAAATAAGGDLELSGEGGSLRARLRMPAVVG